MKNLLLCLTIIVCSGCDERDSWPECDKSIHPRFIPNALFVKNLGSVTMPNGEVCSVEEVNKYGDHVSSYDYYDGDLHCKYYNAESYALVRRLICPSGTSQSTVGKEGSKFRREVIQ